jgi:hypothetical protein
MSDCYIELSSQKILMNELDDTLYQVVRFGRKEEYTVLLQFREEFRYAARRSGLDVRRCFFFSAEIGDVETAVIKRFKESFLKEPEERYTSEGLAMGSSGILSNYSGTPGNLERELEELVAGFSEFH